MGNETEQTTHVERAKLVMQSRDNLSRRQGARDWAVGLRQGGSRSCDCVLFERVVGYENGMTPWILTRKQHSLGWYNDVVDTGIFSVNSA